jgi:hypothetical protein
MYDWNWKSILESITADLTNVLRQYPTENLFKDFIRLTLSKDRLLSVV